MAMRLAPLQRVTAPQGVPSPGITRAHLSAACTVSPHVDQPQRTLLRCHAIGTPVGEEWVQDDYIEVGTLGRPHGVHGSVMVRVSTSSPEQRFGVPGTRYIQPPQEGGLMQRDPVPPHTVTLESGRQHMVKGNEVWLLKFAECDDRDTAEALRNYRLLIHVKDREPLDDDSEFYVQELIGLEVVLSDEGHERDGMILGRVVDVHDGTGTHDVLRIQFEQRMVLDDSGMLVDAVGLSSSESSDDGDDDGKADESQAEGDDPEFEQTSGTGYLPFAKSFVPEVDLDDGCIEITPPDGWLELYLLPKAIKKKKGPRKRRRRSNRKDAVTLQDTI